MNKIKRSLFIFVLISVMLMSVSILLAKEQPIKGKAKSLYSGANIHYNEGRNERAIETYLSVLKEQPDHVHSMKRIGDIYYLMAEEEADDDAVELYKKAKEYFEKVIKTINGINTRYDRFYEYYTDANNRIEAIFAFIWNFGEVCFKEEDYETAEFFYSTLVDLFPDDGRPYMRLANIANAQGDSEKSIEYFQKITDLDPSNTQILMNIAIQMEKDEDYDGAKKYLLMYIEREPQKLSGYTNLAVVCMKLKDYVQALKNLEDALKIDPDNKDIIGSALDVAGEMKNEEKMLLYAQRMYEVDKNLDNIEYLCQVLSYYKQYSKLIDFAISWYEMCLVEIENVNKMVFEDQTEKDNLINGLNDTAKDAVGFIIASARLTKNDDIIKKYQPILDKM